MTILDLQLHFMVQIVTTDNKKNDYGSGGISTKLDAARICMNSGCHMFLANGKKENPIKNMLKNKIYTHFTPKISSLDAKKKWIIGSLNSSGIIFIEGLRMTSLLAILRSKDNNNWKKLDWKREPNKQPLLGRVKTNLFNL